QRILRDALARRVRRKDRRVARGQNVDRVGGHRRHRVGDGKHHADDAPGCVFDQKQPGRIGARLAVHRLHAEYIAHVFQLLNLVVEPAHLGLFQLHLAQLVRAVDADPPHDGDHAPALFQAHLLYLLLCRVGRIDCLVHGEEDAVVRRSDAAGAAGGASVCRRGDRRKGRCAGWLRLLHLGAQPCHNLPRNLRNHLFLVCHTFSKPVIYGFSSTLPSTSTVSTMPTMTASTGASFVAGVRRAELPCVNSTHSPIPAPTLSTATTELPEISSRPSRLMYGWTRSSFIPRNFSFFCVETTLPITFAINMTAHLIAPRSFDSLRSVRSKLLGQYGPEAAVRPRDHMHAHHLAGFLGGCRSRIHRGANAAYLVPSDELDACRLQHCVGGLHECYQALRLNHSNRFIGHFNSPNLLSF